MVYQCEKCEAALPPSVLSCPQCGDSFDEAVPQDAEVPKRGWQAKSGSVTSPPINPEPPVNPTSPSVAITKPHITPLQATPTAPARQKNTKAVNVVLAIFFWPITLPLGILYIIALPFIKIVSATKKTGSDAKTLNSGVNKVGLSIKDILGSPTLSADLKSKLPSIAKKAWWVFLIFMCLSALVLAAQGNMTGFWLVLVLGGPTVWLMRRWQMRNKLLIAATWLGLALIFGIYSLSPSGKAAHAKMERQVQDQEQQQARDAAAEEAQQAAQQKADAARADTEQQQQAKDASVDQLGDVGKIRISAGSQGDIVYVATSQEDFNKMMDAVAAKDDVGLNQMVGNGSLFIVPEGTQAKFIGLGSGFSGIGVRHIRIVDGTHADEDGYIPTEFLKKQ